MIALAASLSVAATFGAEDSKGAERTKAAFATATAVNGIAVDAHARGRLVAGGDGAHDTEHGSLHFSHPLIAESPSPDTKIRVDYFYANAPAEEENPAADRQTLRLEAEWAFAPWLSVEIDAPYTFLNPAGASAVDGVDTVEIGLKYANFTFADQGLLVGGGVEFGLPTGDEEKAIGSNHTLEVEPFIDIGWKHDQLEVVGFLSFGFPINDNGDDEADFELGWNASALLHLTDRVQAIVEFNGQQVFGGEEGGFNAVYVTPGIKFAPLDDANLIIGVGVSLPLTDDKDFYAMPVVSVFYHF